MEMAKHQTNSNTPNRTKTNQKKEKRKECNVNTTGRYILQWKDMTILLAKPATKLNI